MDELAEARDIADSDGPNLSIVTTRVIYIDDSGAETTGYNVFGWVELAV